MFAQMWCNFVFCLSFSVPYIVCIGLGRAQPCIPCMLEASTEGLKMRVLTGFSDRVVVPTLTDAVIGCDMLITQNCNLEILMLSFSLVMTFSV